MEKSIRSKKGMPVVRMLVRIMYHCKSREEISYMWSLYLKLLTYDEGRYLFIPAFLLLELSLPDNVTVYKKF
jgi:hypothetical protein